MFGEFISLPKMKETSKNFISKGKGPVGRGGLHGHTVMLTVVNLAQRFKN